MISKMLSHMRAFFFDKKVDIAHVHAIMGS
jgi:hypothetical protein